MEHLVIDTQDGVRTITLNRPERLNAINDELSFQIERALAAASADDDVRVVVITGKGRGFCAGLDLTDLEGNQRFNTRHEQLDELGWVGRQALSIVHCDKPVLAAINGIAAGAGLSLALACDLSFMSESAHVTTGYVRRGLCPDAGMSYFLPRRVGQVKAAEMIFMGHDVYPDEAEHMGLVNEVFPNEDFHERVRAFAHELASGPPIALTLSKRLLASSPDADLTTLLKQEYNSIQLCFGTKDAMEGMQAFQEKREPVFKGK
ncbi:enoyl-CoA hydratase/isomerase family protein [Tuberibacillus sp. Marseille-P3662]|uniref:enoyl-CoA hydratase/isomerase family protein n=1 Tax=Tuberibacillus sp. Marseille-P3662 TaxID=1965358 RepID=UPI000A1CE2DE|nr:enoyl-CoA hydratase-related protein [Tuberibacillus sp. Marseille-P3662]